MKFIHKLVLMLGVLSCLSCSITAHADVGDDIEQPGVGEEVMEPGTKDDNGWYNQGCIIYQNVNSSYIGTYSWSVSGSKLYLVKNGDTFYNLFADGKYTVTCSYRLDYSSRTESGTWTQEYTSSNINDFSMFQTNLPVFAHGDIDAINAYLNDGDASGAENADDLDDDPDVDSSIELPQDIQFDSASYKLSSYNGSPGLYFSNDVSCMWTQTCDTSNMAYQCQYKITLATVKRPDSDVLSYTADKVVTSDWLQAVPYGYDYKVYSGASTGKRSITKGILNDKIDSMHELYLSSGLLRVYKITIRVRNMDLETGNVSKWVNMTIDYLNGKDDIYIAPDDYDEDPDDDSDGDDGLGDDSSTEEEPSTEDVSTESPTEEYTTEEPSTDDDPFDGDDDFVAPDLPDDEIGIDDFNFKDIIIYIKSGFGLLGQNGILALIAALFQHVPSWIWTLLGVGITFIIIAMVFGLLVKIFT